MLRGGYIARDMGFLYSMAEIKTTDTKTTREPHIPLGQFRDTQTRIFVELIRSREWTLIPAEQVTEALNELRTEAEIQARSIMATKI